MPIGKTTEIVVGLFVLLGLAAFFMLAVKVSNLSGFSDKAGYIVSARFDDIGGLKVRAPVSMGGVRIGRVTSIDLDKQTFQAVVTMTLNPAYPVPEDTSAGIFTAGLLGEHYIGMEPGGAEEFLKENGEIKLTQSALVLERLIGQFLFNVGQDKE